MPEQQIITTRTNPLTSKANSLVFDSLKPCDLTSCTKDDIRAYFNNSYDTYESLFASIKTDEAYYLCPDRLRLPLIFYYGHTACVYINKLTLSGLVTPEERVNLACETIFETGVDEMSWDDTEHYRMGGDYNWPTVNETRNYRLRVRELINKIIDRTEFVLPVNWESPWWAMFMGFEHERIHYETSSVLIRQYPIEMVERPVGWRYGPFDIASILNEGENKKLENTMIKVDATKVTLGKSFEFPSYGWDNEYGHVECKIDAFEASKYKVTNEEFYEFVRAGGYQSRAYWSDEGWQWVNYKQAKHPLFWVCPFQCKSGCGGVIASCSHCKESQFDADEIDAFKQNKNDQVPYKLRLMFDVVKMPKNWPVEINYHEAKAYCAWKGHDFRILTEAEHHAIREKDLDMIKSPNDELIFQFDPKNIRANHNMAYGSSTPVNMFPANKRGFNDVFGNVWEWVEDHFNALPGSKTHYLYDDFSTPCYDGRHNLIMGGSWISTGDEASDFARFMFRRHFYQHCGFRLARSLPKSDKSLPNPQIRLIKDRIFILDFGFPDISHNLNPNLIKLSEYSSGNDQYLYDSHLNTSLIYKEVVYDYELDSTTLWFNNLMKEVEAYMEKFDLTKEKSTLIGASSGRLAFELTKHFNEVVAIDFSSRLLNICLKLQKSGLFENTDAELSFKVSNETAKGNEKVVFKQMTWIPNEITPSDLVLFTMIDRCSQPLSWLRRLREIVKKDGMLIIYSRDALYPSSKVANELLKNFKLIGETSIKKKENEPDAFSAWQKL